ncbi:MAG: LysR family transcriptional regulator [Hyphomicrobiales bacterium]|nr:LysR family transcriptional regulator [Hyphomicrobiales bacterium]
MRSLNPDQLQAFVAVVEKGSFTAAAKSLHLTQPAVSQQVRELENRCGIPLIDRSGKKLRLTETGKTVIDLARHLLAEHEAAHAALRRLKDGAAGRLRAGMSMTVLSHFAAPVLRRFKAENATVTLSMNFAITPILTDMVRDNDLDLAVVTLPIDERGLQLSLCFQEEVVAILPPGTPDPPDVVTPAYMSEQDFILEKRPSTLRQMVDGWFAEAQLSPRVALEFEHVEALRAAVSGGLGAAIVPGMIVREAPQGTAVVVPLKPRLVRRLAVITRSAAEASAPVERLRRMLVEHGTGGRPRKGTPVDK